MGGWRALAALGLMAGATFGATRLLVTVLDARTGRPVMDLKAAEFRVSDEGVSRAVESAEVSGGLLDVMLLLDTSLVGAMVRPVADNLIEQLQAKDQMAVVSFHSAADLIQDFTSSKELLRRALLRVKYGNVPNVLDALYAAIEDGFQDSNFRRAVLLLTAGLEGSSRVSEREVLRVARRRNVSIYPVYVLGSGRSLFENLARQTGGAWFAIHDLKRSGGPPGPRIFEVVRSPYILTLDGNLSLGERIKVEIARPARYQVSALPLE
jgi:VWFA-related protein